VSSAQTLTNKTIDAASNTISDITNSEISASAAVEFSKMENLTTNRALISDGSGDVSASTVTNVELGHVSGVTSSIQTQLDGKEPTITQLPISQGGTNSTTALNNSRIMVSVGGAIVEQTALTANRALTSDASGLPVVSTVTDTELGYVSGVTSSIQSQLDTKVQFNIQTNSGTFGATANMTFLVNVSGGASTVNLPAPVDGAYVILKDSHGNAAVNSITVSTVANGGNVDGATTFVMSSNYESATFISDGTDWFTV